VSGFSGDSGLSGVSGFSGDSGVSGFSGYSGVSLVAASVATLNTGTDNTNFATALGLEGSKYLNQNGAKTSATASGTDTYTVTLAPAITAYVTGQVFDILFTNANTGASTININGLGAIAIKKNGTLALSANDILAGQVYSIFYNGTVFQLIGRIFNTWLPPSISLGTLLVYGASFFVNGGAGVYLSLDGTSDDTIFFNHSLRTPSGISYDGSNIAIRLHCRLSSNASAGNTVGLVLSYAIIGTGDNSTTTVTNVAQQNVDVTGILQDIDFEITLATMSEAAGKNDLLCTITRNSSGAGADSYAGDLEIIGIELIKV